MMTVMTRATPFSWLGLFTEQWFNLALLYFAGR
jgi:hypothetical protein